MQYCNVKVMYWEIMALNFKSSSRKETEFVDKGSNQTLPKKNGNETNTISLIGRYHIKCEFVGFSFLSFSQKIHT